MLVFLNKAQFFVVSKFLHQVAIFIVIKHKISLLYCKWIYAMKQILSKSIVLIGLMGSGKSAVGKMLSEAIGVPLSDTDDIIEKECGKKIYQIFNDSGERYFRQVEEKVVGRTLEDNFHIISTIF